MSTDQERLSLAHALGARETLRPHLSPTPLRQYPRLDRRIGAQLYIKHENHNPTGTFKIRGGINLMHHLAGRGISGVTTYSTGNHGTSVAASARLFGLTATVVVPEGSNPLKVQAIRDAGAELIEHGRDFEAAGQKVAQLVEERGLYFVHPANEPHLIHGVATEFLEIVERVPDLDVMIIPIGAGSEAAAAITVLKQIRPQIEIIAVQAEASQAAYLSWKAGEIVTAPNSTFAGGMATGTAYPVPFALYKEALADFVLLSESELYEGIALAAHHTRNLTEGAGSACLRAAFKIRDRLAGKKVAVQMSGGNASGVELQKAMALPCLTDGTC
ncbi:serine/threonine dehydratase [Desulfosarcina alkanivorans]|uniref:Serine/threonine dehydratase n=1 Tax=Desulfosarcina alkanivorans TaxID=571177 RepID=A0A5K7YP43_9BACT|nr:threonine/serine dehydratase [Desulfosarcina alkanivorans]BBO70085.1 serine/threonine dehydratase [Desulfosarcina alkanivorans]